MLRGASLLLLLWLELSSSIGAFPIIRQQEDHNLLSSPADGSRCWRTTSPIIRMATAAASSSSQENDVSKKTNPEFRLAYITDVEGNYDYFKSFVEQSNVFEQKGLEEDLTLREGCYFVYGGDAVDKGPGDIRLCRILVSLKQRYPNRVFLLVGNRDLNKLRFTAELSESDMARPIDDIPPPHWDPKAPTLRQYLESVVAAATTATATSETKGGEKDVRGSSRSAESVNTRIERLKYMLLHTLGCPHTFEFRRQELAILRGYDPGSTNNMDITDDDVLESFLREVEHPNGSLRQYLEHASVVAVVGNTLFAHGAVDADTARFVPQRNSRFENPSTKPPPGMICDTVQEWVLAMNDYLRYGLDDYAERPNWNEPDRTTRGGESLMALQNRPAMWGRSIVSNCYGDGGVITTDAAAQRRNDPDRIAQSETNPLVFENVSSDPKDPKVSEWLLQNGIRRVVVGHKPLGDSPAVLSAQYTGVEIVSADTSYSDVQAENHRGQAVAVVEIVGPNAQDNHLELSGSFRDGVNYHSVFPTLKQQHDQHDDDDANTASPFMEETGGDPYLGTKLPDDSGGWWIKAATTTHYRLCRGSGRTVEYKNVPKATLREQLAMK